MGGGGKVERHIGVHTQVDVPKRAAADLAADAVLVAHAKILMGEGVSGNVGVVAIDGVPQCGDEERQRRDWRTMVVILTLV